MQKLYILELVLSTETPEIWSSSNTNIDQGLQVKSSWGSTRTGSIVETVEEQDILMQDKLLLVDSLFTDQLTDPEL